MAKILTKPFSGNSSQVIRGSIGGAIGPVIKSSTTLPIKKEGSLPIDAHKPITPVTRAMRRDAIRARWMARRNPVKVIPKKPSDAINQIINRTIDRNPKLIK